jgi:hypothetical protein
MNTRTSIIAAVTAGVLALGTGIAVVAISMPASTTPSSTAPALTASDTEASLLFMMEEEKLAHDVYVVMDATWGGNIFANIQRSESMHQRLLEPVLDSHGLADP